MLTARQNGGLVIVRDNGRKVAAYNAVSLAKEWIALGGGKAFKMRYGFRWDPTRTTLEEARRQTAAQ